MSRGAAAQHPGWPITFKMEDNDGRKVFGYLPEVIAFRRFLTGGEEGNQAEHPEDAEAGSDAGNKAGGEE